MLDDDALNKIEHEQDMLDREFDRVSSATLLAAEVRRLVSVMQDITKCESPRAMYDLAHAVVLQYKGAAEAGEKPKDLPADCVFAFNPEDPVVFDGAGNVTMTLKTFHGLVRSDQERDRLRAEVERLKRDLEQEHSFLKAAVQEGRLSREERDEARKRVCILAALNVSDSGDPREVCEQTWPTEVARLFPADEEAVK